MKQLLSKYNYTYSGACHCEGFATDKYINGDYNLRLRTKKDLFKIKHKGRSITQWIPISMMEETLKNIHINVALQA